MKRLALLLVLVAGCKSPVDPFDGGWRSTWGPVVFAREGDVVIGTYPRGSLRCNVLGASLDCIWVDGDAKGRAKLERGNDGVIRGTWGREDSATDGGAWLFSKIDDGLNAKPLSRGARHHLVFTPGSVPGSGGGSRYCIVLNVRMPEIGSAAVPCDAFVNVVE